MNRNEILSLSKQRLYSDFIEVFLSDAVQYIPLIESLKETERFKEELIFRIYVQTAEQFARVCSGNYEAALQNADAYIELSLALELPELLALNYHCLGIACKHLGYFEKAIECFMNILKYEKIYNFTHLTAMARFYIGEIYLLHDDIPSAKEYIESAIAFLERTKEVEPRYHFKKNLFASLMIQVIYESQKNNREFDFDEMSEYIRILKEYTENDSGIMAIYTYNLSKLVFYFVKKDFEKARAVLQEILALCGEDSETKLQQLKIYLALCGEARLDILSYKDEILYAEKLGESRISFINYYIKKCLYEYYKKIGNEKKAYAYLSESFSYIEKEMIDLKRNKVNSFKLVERNFFALENLSREEKENSELRQVNLKLEKLSLLDGLTQISNRRDFEGRIIAFLRKSKAEGLSIAIFMFDIDNFKKFNDTYGHLDGDKILKTVALIIQQRMDEEGGISARFGGEEFVAACIGLDEEEAVALGNRIREEIFALGIKNEGADTKRLSISAGVAFGEGLSEMDKSMMMRLADDSLYEAKRSGKNKVVFCRAEKECKLKN